MKEAKKEKLMKPIKVWCEYDTHGNIYSDPAIYLERRNATINFREIKEMLLIDPRTKSEIVRRLKGVPQEAAHSFSDDIADPRFRYYYDSSKKAIDEAIKIINEVMG